MKKQYLLTIVWCYKVEPNFPTKRVTKNFLVTLTTNIAREEHMKNHKENYKRVKQKSICKKSYNVPH